jgi:hypothetical protein
MITNERQYEMTKARAAKFREALETDSADPPKGMQPKALNAMREATCSQFEELEE